MAFPVEFPALPALLDGALWNHTVTDAYEQISTTYNRGVLLLRQNEPDAIRLRILAGKLCGEILPILEELTEVVGSAMWTDSTGEALGELVVALEAAAADAEATAYGRLDPVQPIQEERTGKRGRPRKVINDDWLRDAVGPFRNISTQELADRLGIHRNILYKNLKRLGLHRRFDTISNDQLDSLTAKFKERKPSAGLRYLAGYLRGQTVKVPRWRARTSLKRVDGLGTALRRRKVMERHEYHSAHPNAIWHMDGHHKLIMYGIVFHGFIDGHDRTIVGLHASTNNKSSTVLRVFLRAVQKHGAPLRVRGDRGGENVKVSVWMIKYRGLMRRSFSWGTSTRNTPIERLWGEVGRFFVRAWRVFFGRLQRLHGFDPENAEHIWLLHYIFLDDINEDAAEFVENWNNHPMSSRGNRSPNDLRKLGQLTHGVVRDDFTQIHEEVRAQYGDDEEEIDEAIAEDQTNELNHDAVEVDESVCPFASEEDLDTFKQAFQHVKQAEHIPEHLGVSEAEWPEEGYAGGDIELLKVGKVMREIELPFTVWWPRAVKWAQALEVMIAVQESS